MKFYHHGKTSLLHSVLEILNIGTVGLIFDRKRVTSDYEHDISLGKYNVDL